MKWIFWISAVLIAYTYAGYPLWLWMRAQLRPWPVRRGAIEPRVSLAMVVRNEEAVLRDKLSNLLSLDYPQDKCEIVVVSDGSSDRTEEILSEFRSNNRVHSVINKSAGGKALGLNDAIRQAQGDILILTDARQKIEPTAVRLLMENFADAEVGAVSGELMLGHPENGQTGRGMGLYWQVEKLVRELEAASGSVVGATGALYAVRRELLAEIPAETILDDVLIPMNVARQKFRVLFDGRARAWDDPDLGAEREFRRKVRTLTGNYQLLQLAPWLLGNENPLRFEFVSHKLMRLTVPFLLLAMFGAGWFVPGPFYLTMSWAQVVFYILSMLAIIGVDLGPVSRLSDAAYTFVALNAAAAVAFANFLTGNMQVWGHPTVRREIET